LEEVERPASTLAAGFDWGEDMTENHHDDADHRDDEDFVIEDLGFTDDSADEGADFFDELDGAFKRVDDELGSADGDDFDELVLEDAGDDDDFAIEFELEGGATPNTGTRDDEEEALFAAESSEAEPPEGSEQFGGAPVEFREFGAEDWSGDDFDLAEVSGGPVEAADEEFGFDDIFARDRDDAFEEPDEIEVFTDDDSADFVDASAFEPAGLEAPETARANDDWFDAPDVGGALAGAADAEPQIHGDFDESPFPRAGMDEDPIDDQRLGEVAAEAESVLGTPPDAQDDGAFVRGSDDSIYSDAFADDAASTLFGDEPSVAADAETRSDDGAGSEGWDNFPAEPVEAGAGAGDAEQADDAELEAAFDAVGHEVGGFELPTEEQGPGAAEPEEEEAYSAYFADRDSDSAGEVEDPTSIEGDAWSPVEAGAFADSGDEFGELESEAAPADAFAGEAFIIDDQLSAEEFEEVRAESQELPADPADSGVDLSALLPSLQLQGEGWEDLPLGEAGPLPQDAEAAEDVDPEWAPVAAETEFGDEAFAGAGETDEDPIYGAQADEADEAYDEEPDYSDYEEEYVDAKAPAVGVAVLAPKRRRVFAWVGSLAALLLVGFGGVLITRPDLLGLEQPSPAKVDRVTVDRPRVDLAVQPPEIRLAGDPLVAGGGDPVTPPVDPQPTDPQPTDPQPTDPIDPPVDPTDPLVAGGGDPVTPPVDPQPTDPQPTDPQPTDPIDPPVDPTDPLVAGGGDPVTPSVDPQPTDPQPTDPTDPPVDPTDPLVAGGGDPVIPPVDPRPTDPIDPPVDPTDPLVAGGGDPVTPPVDPQPTDPQPTDPTPIDPPVGPTDPLVAGGGDPVLPPVDPQPADPLPTDPQEVPVDPTNPLVAGPDYPVEQGAQALGSDAVIAPFRGDDPQRFRGVDVRLINGSKAFAQLHNGNFFIGTVKSAKAAYVTLTVDEGEVSLHRDDLVALAPLASADFQALKKAEDGFVRLANNNRLRGSIMEALQGDHVILETRSNRILIPKSEIDEIGAQAKTPVQFDRQENDAWLLRMIEEEMRRQEKEEGQKDASKPAVKVPVGQPALPGR